MDTALAAASVISYLSRFPEYRKGTKYLSSELTVKATRRHKLDKRDKNQEFVVTVGRPNYAEREFIKKCKKAGEPFPVKKVQLI